MLQELFNKVNRERGSAGFTLIELLIVVVIIGILAAIAIPQFSSTKDKAYKASMKADLRNMATAQEVYFADNNEYSGDVSALPDYETSDGVNISSITGGADGWSAVADHGAISGTGDCAIYYGSATDPGTSGTDPSSTTSGSPYCQENS